MDKLFWPHACGTLNVDITIHLVLTFIVLVRLNFTIITNNITIVAVPRVTKAMTSH